MPDMDVLEPLENLIGGLLLRRGWKLAVAESCTGGLVCDRVTNIPGSSVYFVGGVVAYANEAKVRLLGVSWDTLHTFGAVSQETVLEMARGVRQALQSEVGIAVSGIAGPGGATEDKPIGLTWIGLSAPGKERSWRFVWYGDRVRNKALSAQAVLQSLVDFLQEDGSEN